MFTAARLLALREPDPASDARVSLQSYAVTLKNRCKRNYPTWSDVFAEKVFRGYCQFIELKIVTEDWDATLLSPSPLIDMMWHQHIFDTNHYGRCCTCDGNLIHHNPCRTFLLIPTFKN